MASSLCFIHYTAVCTCQSPARPKLFHRQHQVHHHRLLSSVVAATMSSPAEPAGPRQRRSCTWASTSPAELAWPSSCSAFASAAALPASMSAAATAALTAALPPSPPACDLGHEQSTVPHPSSSPSTDRSPAGATRPQISPRAHNVASAATPRSQST